MGQKPFNFSWHCVTYKSLFLFSRKSFTMIPKPACLALLVLSSYTLASPLPQEEKTEMEEGRDFNKETAKTTAGLLNDIAFSFFSIFSKTGQLVKAINDESIGHSEISRHSESLSDLGVTWQKSWNEDHEDLADQYATLQENLPTLKNHVKTALAKVPGIHDTIQEQIDNSPDKETIKSYVSDFFKSLPESWSHPAIDEARDSVLETIDSLPEKDFVKEQVSSFAEKVPSSDKINEYVDDYVEVLGTAVDELNNVPSDAVDA